MDVTFDEQADALYIRFQRSKHVKKTVKVADGLLIDLDRAGRLFGIEILDATRRISSKQLGKLTTNLPLHD